MKKPDRPDRRETEKLVEEVDTLLNEQGNTNGTHENGVQNEKSKNVLKIGPYKDWISLPNIRVKDFINTGICEKLYAPKGVESEKVQICKSVAFAKTTSTYPKGLGEPICDYYAVELYEKRTLLSIADGCGWGSAALQAAIRATEAYMDYLRESQKQIFDVKEAGRIILRAFSKAHTRIIQPFKDANEDVWDAGTTTLCGGTLMELVDDLAPETIESFNNLHLGSNKCGKDFKFFKDKQTKTFSVKLKEWTDTKPDVDLDSYVSILYSSFFFLFPFLFPSLPC